MSDVKADAKAIFVEGLDCQGADELRRYLEQACGSDAALRRRVDELLQAHRDAGAFLGGAENQDASTDQPVAQGPGPRTVNGPGLAECPGTTIGPYKLMEQIGEGGMGLVFVAEQQHPVRRKVALKVIKPGMDTRQVIARFEAERQALALMDHPHIAQVHDGGTTPAGRPYFVMELVKGVPITTYCDHNQLPVRERLALFVDVCQAVQHAHQKGIIHRDLKPSNVLVASHDGKPVVKVIDFGVAKALGQELTDKTVYTQLCQLIGTPLYMAPEQAGESSLDVDTRSDIYALGVLLYELLTGTTPFDRERFKGAGYEEIRRIIREEEPPRPSTRISTLGQAAPTVSAQRQSDPKRLSTLLRGESDWIVMKALDKDRNRRYETASAFAADVQRYLADEPVLACPPSTGYRFRKLVRRNKVLFVTATIVAATLMAASLVVAWKWLDADTAWRAESVANGRASEALALAQDRGEQLQKDLDRLNAANGHVELAHLLADSGQWDQAESNFAQAVQLRPDNSYTLLERGRMYVRLGLWRLANADLERAYRLQEPARAQTFYDYAVLRLFVGDRKGYDRVCTRMFERFGQNPDDTDLYLVAAACIAGPDPVTAARQLVTLAERAAAAQRNAGRLNALGVAHFRTGQYDKAVAAIKDSLAVDPNWNKSWNYAYLAMAHHRLGQSELARQELQEAGLALDKTVQAWFENPVGQLPNPWWHVLESQMHYREARELIDGAAPAEDARLWVIRSRALAALKRDREAAECRARALQLRPHDIHIRLVLLPPEQNGRQLAAALAALKKLVQEHPEQKPEGKRALAQKYCDLAWKLRSDKRYEEAVQAYGQAIEVVPDYTPVWFQRGWVRLDILKQYSLAVPDWSKVIELEPNNASAWNHRGFAYRKLHQCEKAIADLNKAIELNAKYLWAWNSRGIAYIELAQYDKAIADFNMAIKLDPKNSAPWVNRGLAYTELHLYQKAIADCSMAIQLDPNNSIAWNNRADTYCQLRQFDKAIADSSRAIQVDPNRSVAWCTRGNTYCALRQFDKAVADCSKAIDLDPKDARFWKSRGTVYAEVGQWQKAASDLGKVTELQKNNVSAWYGRAVLCLKLGDHKAYRQVCGAMLDSFRGAPPDTARLVAWTCALGPASGMESGRVVERATKLAAQNAKNRSDQTIFGAALYRAGRFKEAVRRLEQAAALPADPFQSVEYTWFFLAMTHHRLGHAAEARTWLEKGRKQMKQKAKDADLPWDRRLALELLRGEAEALLGSKKTPRPETNETKKKP
jgi:tetratricopeptide (TPR) repeat protein